MLKYVSTLPTDAGSCGLFWQHHAQFGISVSNIWKSFLPSKIIHRIIFEIALYFQSALETLFTCKRVSNFRKCACTDKVFRTLRSAPKGFALGKPTIF